MSLMKHTDFLKNFGNIPLRTNDCVLGSYSGHTISVVGEADMNDGLNNLPLMVVFGSANHYFDGLGQVKFSYNGNACFEVPSDSVNQVSQPENVMNSKNFSVTNLVS